MWLPELKKIIFKIFIASKYIIHCSFPPEVVGALLNAMEQISQKTETFGGYLKWSLQDLHVSDEMTHSILGESESTKSVQEMVNSYVWLKRELTLMLITQAIEEDEVDRESTANAESPPLRYRKWDPELQVHSICVENKLMLKYLRPSGAAMSPALNMTLFTTCSVVSTTISTRESSERKMPIYAIFS